MARLFLGIAVALAAVVFTGGAAAKELGAELRSAPATAAVGRPVTITFALFVRERTVRHPVEGTPPTLVVYKSGPIERAVQAEMTGTSGLYRVTIAFPEPGTWTYELRDPSGAPVAALGTIDVRGAEAAAAGGGGLAVWLVAVAVVAALALAGGVLAHRLRARPAAG